MTYIQPFEKDPDTMKKTNSDPKKTIFKMHIVIKDL